METNSTDNQESRNDNGLETYSPIQINREQFNNNDLYALERKEYIRRMKFERERLKSFQQGNWNVSFIDPKDLAKVGFFYLMDQDKVECAFCEGIVRAWEVGDIPLNEHLRHYPRCVFLQGYDVGNVPIDRDPIRDDRLLLGYDHCGTFVHSPNMFFQIEPRPSTSLRRNPSNSSSSSNEYAPGVLLHKGPKRPDFASLDARFNSFDGNAFEKCGISFVQFAEAGFYYFGKDDQVQCFYCDRNLSNWEKGDDPWVEHARWFPDCHFVILNKGLSFIQACVKKSSNINAKANAITIDFMSMNDNLGAKIVNNWMNSEFIHDFRAQYSYSAKEIRKVLEKRWLDQQKPFESFENLQESIEKSINEESKLKTPESSDDSSISSISPTNSFRSSTNNTQVPSDRMICKICLDREISVLFLPCGHVVACSQCAPGITNCPICRRSIDGIVKTFFS